MRFRQILQKGKSLGRVLQKGLSTGGAILQKASQVGNKVLDQVTRIDPALAANPIYMGARAATAGLNLAGKLGQGLGAAKSIDDVGSSLKEAYSGAQSLKGPETAA